MLKKMMVLLGAAVALTAVLVVGCGKDTATSTATGCEGNLPCTVSTNIN